MTTHSLRRVDHLLNELVELVETARAVPMSGSCMVPREHLLDLLDELRDAVPPELEEARHTLAQRDSLLAQAEEVHRQALERSGAEADAMLAEARQRADELVSAADTRAYELVEAGKAEHSELVSASRVHQSASNSAARLRAEADEYAAGVRAEADDFHAERLAAAQESVAAMRTDAESFADRTLVDLIAVLQRATATAEQGRKALAARRERPTTADSQPISE